MTQPEKSEAGDCGSHKRLRPRWNDGQVLQLADLCKALADPTRLHILDILSQSNGLVGACELEGSVGVPGKNGKRPCQSTISHHLKILRDAGLICYTRSQQWIYYSVCPEKLGQVRDLLELVKH